METLTTQAQDEVSRLNGLVRQQQQQCTVLQDKLAVLIAERLATLERSKRVEAEVQVLQEETKAIEISLDKEQGESDG